jgi:hypothetical protein
MRSDAAAWTHALSPSATEAALALAAARPDHDADDAGADAARRR